MGPEQALKHFGLTDAEIRVYLLLIASLEKTASEIAQKTNTNRTFTYDRLKKLLEAGLISYVIKDNKKYFRPAPPEHLLEILKEKEAQIKEILPHLTALKQVDSAVPKIDIFSSKKGVRTALNLLLKDRQTIYLHGSLKSFKDTMKDFFDIWNKRRATAKVRLKALTTDREDLPLCEMDFLSEDESAAISTFTSADKSVIVLWTEVPVALMIQSLQFAKDNLQFFNTIWNREIRIYSGESGIRQAFMELISQRTTEHIGFGYSWELAKVYGKEFSDKWHKLRLKHKIKSKLISYNDTDSKKYFDRRMISWPDFQIRFLPREVCGPACVTLSDHLIVTFIYTEKRLKVIVNKNKETISVYKKFFHSLWQKAKLE